jgi:hypothetical protein
VKARIIAVILLLGAAAGGYYLYVRSQGPADSAVLAEAKREVAACPSPSAPGPAPDGATASKDQMLAAAHAASDFDKATTVYTACLKSVQQRLRDAHEFSATTDLQQVDQFVIEKNNVAIDRDQKVADQVNEQIRKFKAR